uniref:Uncharacterized protein n=1 Tax=Populus trichocarpa TaxID=3694 RepID=A0A3N7FH09_POPTR
MKGTIHLQKGGKVQVLFPSYFLSMPSSLTSQLLHRTIIINN